jgi:hypothetical protein
MHCAYTILFTTSRNRKVLLNGSIWQKNRYYSSRYHRIALDIPENDTLTHYRDLRLKVMLMWTKRYLFPSLISWMSQGILKVQE